MAVRKDKNSWWVDFRFNHRRYRKRSPENSKIGAQAYEALLRQRLARGESTAGDEAKPAITFEQFAWEWFQTYVLANNKFSEQYAKRKTLTANLIPFFGALPLSAINSMHIERYKAKHVGSGISNKTINNRLAILAKCLRCAHEWHGIEMPIIKLLRCTPPKTDYLTPAECDLLLARATAQLYEMIFLALRTGMRQGEIRGLQWSSIDWQSRSIAVRHSRYDRTRTLVSPKSNRERHIPLDLDLYEMLFRRRQTSGYVFTNLRRDGEPFTSHRIEEDLSILCCRAQVRKITWHVLRHTFATHLTLRGVPLTVVKELLGHSTIVTTMRYSHVAPSVLRSAIDILNPRSGAIAEFWSARGQPEAAGNASESPGDATPVWNHESVSHKITT
jgi:integrase